MLAGRDEDRVREQAEILGASWRIVSLGSVEALTEALSDIGAVIHAAGPFVVTAPPMIEACLRAQTHYLDVSGELPVFREAFGRDGEAVRAGVMLMPGAAWSVAATDCLGAHVARRLAGAKYLRLGMTQSRLYSRGTARSAFGLMSSEVVIRRNGRLTTVPIGRMERDFDYGEGERRSMALSWPDALSAYHTTGIPNIEAYMEVGAAGRFLAPLTGRIGEALQLPVSTPPASRQRVDLAGRARRGGEKASAAGYCRGGRGRLEAGEPRAAHDRGRIRLYRAGRCRDRRAGPRRRL